MRELNQLLKAVTLLKERVMFHQEGNEVLFALKQKQMEKCALWEGGSVFMCQRIILKPGAREIP